MNSTQ